MASDLMRGSRNLDKKDLVKLDHVQVNNGVMLLEEVKAKNMCKKEVLSGSILAEISSCAISFPTSGCFGGECNKYMYMCTYVYVVLISPQLFSLSLKLIYICCLY